MTSVDLGTTLSSSASKEPGSASGSCNPSMEPLSDDVAGDEVVFRQVGLGPNRLRLQLK